MTESNSRSRARRSGQVQQLYAARENYPQGMEDAVSQQTAAADINQYRPNEEPVMPEAPGYDWSRYTPNEPDGPTAPADVQAAGEPGPDEVHAAPVDFSAYYRRGNDMAEEVGDAGEPAFAPPPKLGFHGLYNEPAAVDEPAAAPMAQMNVYRPREATWAETARRDVLTAAGGVEYRVEDERERPRKRRRRRHMLRRAIVFSLIVAALCTGVYLFRDQIEGWIGNLTGQSAESAAPFEALTTPVPVKGYDPAPPVEIADRARTAIGQLSGTVEMETYAVTDTHVLARNARPDGTYDFYLFTADEGKLLCYFDGLGPRDMVAQEGGSFYVKQEPYLVGANGSALLRTNDIEATLGEEMTLAPLYGGWSIISGVSGHNANYINTNGQLLSTLWFARAYPFTGVRTIAYVDTGNVADAEERYLLYVLDSDGTMTKWRNAPDMSEVVGSACGAAYMSSGELYRLDNTEEPLAVTDQVDVYLDCDAMVVRDPESGKYGLFVHGEQHYDFEYDSIEPVACDIEWAEKPEIGAGGNFTLHAVTNAAYPQPLSHYFVLAKDGQEEYVALSTSSAYPIVLDGEP